MTGATRDIFDILNEDEESDDMVRRIKAKMIDDDPMLLLGDGTSLFDEIERYFHISKVKRILSLGTELFTAATPFLDHPTYWIAGKSIFAMGKVLVEDVEVWADDYFSGDEWVEPYNADFNQTLLHVLQKLPYERIKTVEENTLIRVCTLPGGGKAGWAYSGRLQTVDHVWFDSSKLEESKAYVKQMLWEQYKGKSLVMRKNEHIIMDEARVTFEVDDAFEAKLSKRAVELSEQLKKPLDEGVARSIMFYGPPGTGKSTLARTIVELMNLRSFRIRIADLGGLSNATLFEAINIFEPDAVILDDFDRASSQAQLLETLEFFQQKVKLVITTVNDRNNLDDALLRPGRIDILELVDRMDKEVIKHVLGEYVDGYEIVKAWPIAFINEYVKRRRYLSIDEAATSVVELARRVGELRSHGSEKTNNDDMKRMLKLLAASAKKDAKSPEEDHDPLALMMGSIEDDMSELDEQTTGNVED